ncbi:MAG TPA: PspC domain-containing protein [Candidatus Paceibacterota bacterium]|nr:PspC domain-containing protein [Candidatus Paceibacterota bacterium]
MRKLYRHTKGERHVAGGVFAGLGDWLEVSPGILRAGYIALAIFSGVIPGILLYLAAMLLMKKNPAHEVHDI